MELHFFLKFLYLFRTMKLNIVFIRFFIIIAYYKFSVMEKTIITLGRQFGSGGREIGKKLAARLHIDYYDKELLQLAAKESGLCTELFEKADEKTSVSLLQAFAMGFSMNGVIFQPGDYFTDATLFRVQSDVIRKIASEKSCVIVGRCADYILSEEKSCTNIFIHASQESRIARILRQNPMSEKEALEVIRKADKTRATYYNYYTDKTWGAAASYHLCIDSSVADTDEIVDFIKTFVEKRHRH